MVVDIVAVELELELERVQAWRKRAGGLLEPERFASTVIESAFGMSKLSMKALTGAGTFPFGGTEASATSSFEPRTRRYTLSTDVDNCGQSFGVDHHRRCLTLVAT
jgi:hypothetical protein